MLEALKEEVYQANRELVEHGLIAYTWGNASGIDREKGIVVIKPSGVPYEELSPDKMVCVDLESGQVVDGALKPSSDTPTHLELYRAFPKIGGIAHTHSTYAVAFAQAGMPIPALGTTHADYFYGDVPCARSLTADEVAEGYEANTGKVIIEEFEAHNPEPIPAVIVRNHGPFTWGSTAMEAAFHAVVLEEVAQMAHLTLALNPSASLDAHVLDKHYTRKHGSNAYYGQDPRS